MELNGKVLVKVAVMLFLLGITATVEARFDAGSFIEEVVPNADTNYYSVKSTPTAPCICTLPWPIMTCICPPEECHPACSSGSCICQVNAIDGSSNCNCADKTMLSPGAGAH